MTTTLISMAALLIPLALLAVLVMMAQAQALTPPPPQAREIGTTDTTGETTNWLTSTTAGFVVRYPPDWQRRILPDQIAGTQIVEFTHSKNGCVDASIQVLETWLLPGETWEQTPELMFWREQGARTNYLVESVLVARHMGWMVSAQLPLHRGDLARTVLVGRDGRLYRFRLYLYQSEATELYMQVLGLMMGTLQPVKDAAMPPIVMSPASTPHAHDIAPSGLTTSTLNYNRGLAYAYARTWWNKRNNGDGCYLWYNGSVLDCTYHEGDWGVDGAHFINQAVRAGGRPIPPLLPDWPYEARTVPALRTWLLNDGWTAIPAAQAQVGDVVIVGNQCWAGLIGQATRP